jgi:hypothetical protein
MCHLASSSAKQRDGAVLATRGGGVRCADAPSMCSRKSDVQLAYAVASGSWLLCRALWLARRNAVAPRYEFWVMGILFKCSFLTSPDARR